MTDQLRIGFVRVNVANEVNFENYKFGRSMLYDFSNCFLEKYLDEPQTLKRVPVRCNVVVKAFFNSPILETLNRALSLEESRIYCFSLSLCYVSPVC